MTTVLVTGGSRSGKSEFAETLAGGTDVLYVATGPTASAGDPEWAVRVAAHRERRPSSWSTYEGVALAPLLGQDGPPMLIDGIGTWLAVIMDRAGAWAGGSIGPDVAELVDAWSRTTRHVVAVTDEVGSGIVPETPAGRRFRDELGRLNQALAAAADEVYLVTVGIPSRLR